MPLHENPDERRLLDAALAIADGAAVDWSNLALSTPEPAAALIDGLQLLEAVARAHEAAMSPVEGLYERREHDSLLHPEGRTREADDDPGVVWGPLTVIEKVGYGSYGDVYRAWDTRLDREVALKLLRHRAAVEGELGRAVIDEGRLLARVRHPNVVIVHGAERIDGRVGIWMEFIHGQTLAAELEERGPFDAVDVARIGVALCSALAAVHDAGLLHRDVKAQNVMRDRSGRVVLGDFGTGIELASDDAPASVRVAGTPLYIAPDVLDGTPASVASDLYSLGVLLYHLATGEFPVEGRSVREVRDSHRAGRRTLLVSRRPDLDPSFVEIVDHLLDAGPDRTYGSAAAAGVTLSQWLDAPARPSMPVASWWQRPRTVAAASIALALAITTFSLREYIPALRSTLPRVGWGSTVHRLITKDPDCFGPVSPEGRFAACVEVVSRNIATVDLATGHVTRVTSTGSRERREGGVDPAISPDGAHLAYRWILPNAPEEIRISPSGGGAERVVQRAGAGQALALFGWRPGSQTLVVHQRSGPEHRLLQLDARTGLTNASVALDGVTADDFVRLFGWSRGNAVVGVQSRRLRSVRVVVASHDGIRSIATLDSAPQFATVSEDGRWLAYDALQNPQAPERDIRLLDLDTARVHRAIAHPANDVAPIWMPDGAHLLFSSDRAGPMGLWAVAVRDGEPVSEPALIRDLGRRHLAPIRVAQDGTLFYQTRTSPFDVLTADVDPASGVASAPVRLDSPFAEDHVSPEWSRDGASLAYVSARGPFSGDPGATRIAIKDMRRNTLQEFVRELRFASARLRWSPDGRTLAMRGAVDGVWGIHLFDAAQGGLVRTLRPPTTSRFVEDALGDLGWGTDGHTLIVARDAGISSIDLATEQVADLVSPDEGAVQALAVSPDGTGIGYSTSNSDGSWSIRLASVAGGPPRELLREAKPVIAFVQSWTPDGQDLLYTRWASDVEWRKRREELWKVPVAGGPPRSMGLVVPGMREVRPNPDGRPSRVHGRPRNPGSLGRAGIRARTAVG
ncbi:Serine/threonine-protein kinase PrkC [Luteitalea pratensis]|uniref:Serine/threonine-protein kinase PrkC n=1 Tax=Luteitalea pratensis TaxID=1855912 RepID=A0A143PNR2_LUTPR|nr:protein kinase [Luteitalea pratensis]AMY09419.1 Serine/threonine-protein kinase PrkC [Luteitalea pratensis]